MMHQSMEINKGIGNMKTAKETKVKKDDAKWNRNV